MRSNGARDWSWHGWAPAATRVVRATLKRLGVLSLGASLPGCLHVDGPFGQSHRRQFNLPGTA